jgi:type II secretory ATPase GspE/PulE/Tfp pilus assembly ATPase PilB-like protein
MRLLDRERLPLSFDALGLRPEWQRVLQGTLAAPHGLVLVTGPTGSGKTTTLYAALNTISTPEVNVSTVEDPIEYDLEGINQTGVRADIGLTFASVLRAQLRQDPDVLIVGEIRDGETAQIAVRAALTGHLVLSTLHTNDAASTVSRLLDVGVEPFLVASSLRLVLAQRLVRKVCPACVRERELSAEEAERLGLGVQRVPEAVGCETCSGTGYRGRTPVMELMQVGEEIASLVGGRAPGSELREAALRGGMVLLREAAAGLVAEGVTTPEEALRQTF